MSPRSSSPHRGWGTVKDSVKAGRMRSMHHWDKLRDGAKHMGGVRDDLHKTSAFQRSKIINVSGDRTSRPPSPTKSVRSPMLVESTAPALPNSHSSLFQQPFQYNPNGNDPWLRLPHKRIPEPLRPKTVYER